MEKIPPIKGHQSEWFQTVGNQDELSSSWEISNFQHARGGGAGSPLVWRKHLDLVSVRDPGAIIFKAVLLTDLHWHYSAPARTDGDMAVLYMQHEIKDLEQKCNPRKIAS